MSDSGKRKNAPNTDQDNRDVKRSKGGSGGKWQTPHHKAKIAAAPHRAGGKIEPGNMGIWATCTKGKEGAATEELKRVFEDHAERIYDKAERALLSSADDPGGAEEDDIELAIKREKQSLRSKQGPAKRFTPVYLDMPCVLFFKTNPPISPVDFVHSICEDARQHPEKRAVRFVNRLTPMTLMGKATEKGLEEVGKTVLREHFQLAGDETHMGLDFKGQFPSYAIRPTFRNHNTLKRDAVINLVASLVRSNHKVDLDNPDKVIIIEIYQTVCGMSVVGGDWEGLKRYNLAEIYQPTPKPPKEVTVNTQPKVTSKIMPKSEVVVAEATVVERTREE